MNKIRIVLVASFFSMISLSALADNITATDTTLDGAEEKIAAEARRENAHYKIIQASTNNRIHITAKIYKPGSAQ